MGFIDTFALKKIISDIEKIDPTKVADAANVAPSNVTRDGNSLSEIEGRAPTSLKNYSESGYRATAASGGRRVNASVNGLPQEAAQQANDNAAVPVAGGGDQLESPLATPETTPEEAAQEPTEAAPTLLETGGSTLEETPAEELTPEQQEALKKTLLG
ncbi:MAG: hypothetical protein ACO2ZP_00570 [Bacteriovoracaceae bacterium]